MPASVNKNGTGTWTLSGSSSYSGNTKVNAGTLALGNGGALSSTAQINIALGATFDVSAITSYTLGTGTTLIAGGTGTTIGTNAAVLKGGTPWERPDVYKNTSVTLDLNKITTPTLILRNGQVESVEEVSARGHEGPLLDQTVVGSATVESIAGRIEK